jgi:diguanylate cyclase (GGDEF)-like protein/PAS domain S-box-containing protein
VPHVAQILGGALFIGISRRRWRLTVLPRDLAEALQRQELQFRASFEHAPIGIALLSVPASEPARFLQVNPTLCATLGYSPQDLVDRPYLDLVCEQDQVVAWASRERLLAGTDPVEAELHLHHRDGRRVLTSTRSSAVHGPTAGQPATGLPLAGSLAGKRSGQDLLVVVQVRDITDERRREAQLRHLADHDGLTEVFNRRRLEEELNRAVEHSRRHAEPAALLIVDLDHFKYVNDTYGHALGDQMLQAIASALRHRLRATDVIGRLGGDEFGVICPHTDAGTARTLAQALLDTLRRDAHVIVSGRTVRCAASIGISLLPGEDTATGEQLLAEADVAMYQAKEAGRERVFVLDHDGAGLAQIRARLTYAERIRDALAHGGFRLWEQPILNLATGICDRSELLLRMIDPDDDTLVPPNQFLPVAERFGQIQAIDQWVFGQALRLLALRQHVGDHRAVEINLSGASLTDAPLIDSFADQLDTARIDPTRLIVEVTETTAVSNIDLARSVASRLTDAGCSFALDDFGSGFGSFYYLKHLPFHGIKIDGEFVKGFPHSTADRLTVEAIAGLAHGLGKETTAEYVQDETTLDWLRGIGIGYAQGRHISSPHAVLELPA